ncbi:hypothetical protein ACIQWI_07095 [Peribacillus frigoritolerans]
MQKKSHGMLWTASGRKILSVQATLTFAAMNIKKISNWTGKGQKWSRSSILYTCFKSQLKIEKVSE